MEKKSKIFTGLFLLFLGGVLFFSESPQNPTFKNVEEDQETVIYLSDALDRSNRTSKEESTTEEEETLLEEEKEGCAEESVNINSATLRELEKLNGIGPVYAQRIKEKRPFNSLNDLLEVNGIGEVTLENIKSQGCAST